MGEDPRFFRVSNPFTPLPPPLLNASPESLPDCCGKMEREKEGVESESEFRLIELIVHIPQVVPRKRHVCLLKPPCFPSCPLLPGRLALVFSSCSHAPTGASPLIKSTLRVGRLVPSGNMVWPVGLQGGFASECQQPRFGSHKSTS